MLYFKKKGKFGYLKAGKIQTLVYTILLFAVSLCVFFIGYKINGTKKNLFSIIAVLGILPAAKSFVNFVMFAKAKECPLAVYEAVQKIAYPGTVLYDMQITAYERAYRVDALVCDRKQVIGLSTDQKCKFSDLEKHIQNILKSNGHKEFAVKIFDDENKFYARLKGLMESEEGILDNGEVLTLMLQISL